MGCGRGWAGLGAGGSRLRGRRAGQRGPWGALGLGRPWAAATGGVVPCRCPCRLPDTPVLVPPGVCGLLGGWARLDLAVGFGEHVITAQRPFHLGSGRTAFTRRAGGFFHLVWDLEALGHTHP